MYSIIYYSAGRGRGFSHHGFPPEGGDQNGLGILAKHRGAEDVVGYVLLASLQWVESLICRSIFVYLACVRGAGAVHLTSLQWPSDSRSSV